MATAWPLRVRAAVAAMRLVNATSRRLGRGSGTVAGGRVALAVAPNALAALARDRATALVSATNGKTTTTALLAAALATQGPVATNATGSNMTAGHVAALASTPSTVAALEVDEAYVDVTERATLPRVLVLGNLSRDQLDRASEVRMLASRWRGVCERTAAIVVANVDDPLVVFAASAARSVRWVAAGATWLEDATGCPACDVPLTFDATSWGCRSCDLGRPTPAVTVTDDDGAVTYVLVGVSVASTLALPGSFNRGNAALALAAATALGVDAHDAAHAMASVVSVAGRYATREVAGRTVQTYLAKNPAGFAGLLDLVADGSDPVVIAINARIADGADPSWLFDVPFEMLRGRHVVATGDRRHDLAVRLAYAEVEASVADDVVRGIELAAPRGTAVTFIGNYTAFADLSSVAP